MLETFLRRWSIRWTVLAVALLLTAAARAGEPETRRLQFAVGSCLKLASLEDRAPTLDRIADSRPDLMIWLGDNWYLTVEDNPNETDGKKKGQLVRGEWSTEAGLLRKARFVHGHPDTQRLLHEVENFATWDDHDFGFNNAPLGDRETLNEEEVRQIFAGRETALRVFQTMWKNPHYGTPETPGAFCAFRRGPAAFFLLDGRYYKDAPNGILWGRGQLDWLKVELRKAEADGVPAKFIGTGSQILAATGKESLNTEAPGELAELLDFLVAENISNVFFMSGDRHRSELWVREHGGRTFVELTASPLFHTLRRVDPENYPDRVWVGPPVDNFGWVTVETDESGGGFVTLEARNASGDVLPNIGPTREPKDAPCQSRFALTASSAR